MDDKIKILTTDATIDELKYYCNQLKIFLGMNKMIFGIRNEINNNFMMIHNKKNLDDMEQKLQYQNKLTYNGTIKIKMMYDIIETIAEKIKDEMKIVVNKIVDIKKNGNMKQKK